MFPPNEEERIGCVNQFAENQFSILTYGLFNHYSIPYAHIHPNSGEQWAGVSGGAGRAERASMGVWADILV